LPGKNGAGNSALIKMIYGLVRSDECRMGLDNSLKLPAIIQRAVCDSHAGLCWHSRRVVAHHSGLFRGVHEAVFFLRTTAGVKTTQKWMTTLSARKSVHNTKGAKHEQFQI